MTALTVPPEVPPRDPEQTDRWPEVQRLVDEFVDPVTDQNGGE